MKITVSKETGDFTTVQAALDALPQTGGEIFIKEGTYKEKLRVEKDNITITGEGADKTILTYDDGAKKRLPNNEEYGTFRTASFFVNANNFTARGITFVNAAGPGMEAGQALAIYTNGDKHAFYNCRFLGHQDTVFTAPRPEKKKDGSSFEAEPRSKPLPSDFRVYFKECFIKGDVDFIFGGATAFFDQCEIFSCTRDMEPNGYITAASTPQGQEWGYVFHDCRLTSDCAPDSVYLGRPWRDYAHVAFINCHMDAHVKKEGWHNWNRPEAEATVRYEEYGSTGPGGDMSKRVPWSKILMPHEVTRYTADNVLGNTIAEINSG